MRLAMVITGNLLIIAGLSSILVQFLFPSSSLLYWSGLAFPLIGIAGGVLLLFLAPRVEKKD